MIRTIVPESWTRRLADAIASAIRDIAPRLAGEPVVILALDCHPWNGSLSLAALTAAEVSRDPSLATPEEIAAWQHYDFARELSCWGQVTGLGHEMKTEYSTTSDRSATAEEFFQACAAAILTPQVSAAAESLARARGFRVSVAHPDNGHEFVPTQ